MTLEKGVGEQKKTQQPFILIQSNHVCATPARSDADALMSHPASKEGRTVCGIAMV